MADRFVLKQFAGSATNNGAFGAAQATGAGVQPVANIKDVQSLNAFEQGWNSATLTADKLPALEEMQGLEALLCKAIKENYSEGIPLWISGETYYQDSRAVYNGKVYRNKTGSYTANNPATDTANWELDKPDTAGTADKLGSSTVGSATQGIYLNNGVPTPMTAEFANQDLSNLSAVGQAVIDDKANIDLDNLSATGEAHFANPDLSNLSATGQEVINGKADIDASNFNAAGKSLLSGLGAPSDTYESLTLLASGQTYTASGNGYIVVTGVSKTTNAYVDLTNRATGLADIGHIFSGFNAAGYWCSATLPVKKDDVVRLRYSGMQLSGDLYPLEIKYVKAVGEV